MAWSFVTGWWVKALQRGRFITLEGGEGVGKSTQMKHLSAEIASRGHNVIITREPGGSVGAEAIRALLMTGNEDRWSARAEALLFAAARADHVEKTILPAIESGAWVLCDRFIDSTRAYQGGAGGLDDAEIMALHKVGSKGLLPDRTLLLELPVAAGAARSEARDNGAKDRMGSKSADYYARVAERFRILADAEPARFHVVDAVGTESEVTSRLLAALDDIL
jgi:dTMP kinase